MIKHIVSDILGRRLLAAVAGLLFASTVGGCSSGEDTLQPKRSVPGTLRVEVRDRGYGGEESRSADRGWRTNFTVGDRIGLFVVEAGKVTKDNLCLTLDENGVWTAPAGAQLFYEPEATYYAYYPWQADMRGKIDPAAATAEEFFAPLAAGWIPGADQGTHDAYTSWDLMTCAGMVVTAELDNTRSLLLDMSHRMSVAAIELPGTKYTTPDGFAYSTPPAETDFAWDGAECRPYLSDGLYRILYNPALPSEVSGEYSREGARRFSFTPSVPAGTYKVYRVDGGLTDGGERSLKAGDLYYGDGSILPAERAALLPAGTAPKGCIGIVFQTDPERIGAAEKALFAAKEKTVHGVAMSVKSAGDNHAYGWYYDASKGEEARYTRDESIEDPAYPGYVLPHIYDADYAKCYALADADLNGYFNTEVIRVRRKDDLGLYSAFRATLDFAAEAGGPAADVFTTGWYLPSNGQWFDFLRNVAGVNLSAANLGDWESGDFYWQNNGDIPSLLNAAMRAVPDGDKTTYASDFEWFWTSSAASPAKARLVKVNWDGHVYCRRIDKHDRYYVRYAIAF